MSQMSPVWVLILFQSVILRLADTESTPRLSSLAHLITLNCLNHQNQLWSFADAEVFSSMKKCLFCGALRLGDPLIKLLELKFVSSSSETSRSSGTIQTSQSSISSHPVFPDVLHCHVAAG